MSLLKCKTSLSLLLFIFIYSKLVIVITGFTLFLLRNAFLTKHLVTKSKLSDGTSERVSKFATVSHNRSLCFAYSLATYGNDSCKSREFTWGFVKVATNKVVHLRVSAQRALTVSNIILID